MSYPWGILLTGSKEVKSGLIVIDCYDFISRVLITLNPTNGQTLDTFPSLITAKTGKNTNPSQLNNGSDLSD